MATDTAALMFSSQTSQENKQTNNQSLKLLSNEKLQNNSPVWFSGQIVSVHLQAQKRVRKVEQFLRNCHCHEKPSIKVLHYVSAVISVESKSCKSDFVSIYNSGHWIRSSENHFPDKHFFSILLISCDCGSVSWHFCRCSILLLLFLIPLKKSFSNNLVIMP